MQTVKRVIFMKLDMGILMYITMYISFLYPIQTIVLQVSSWGGYVFLINLIPLLVLVLIMTGRFSHRIYFAYSSVSFALTLQMLGLHSSKAQEVKIFENLLNPVSFVFIGYR